MKKVFFFSVLLFLAILFSGCGSSNNLIMEDWTVRPALSDTSNIKVTFANEIPVIPENAVSIATVETNPEADCTVEAAMDFLWRKAGELGANFLYIKAVRERLVFQYYGFFSVSKRCNVVYADFLEVK